jgi:hypothetical protein
LISALANAAAQVSSMPCRVRQRNKALDMPGGGSMDAAFVANGMIAPESVTKPSASAAAVMNRRMANHPLLLLRERSRFDPPNPLTRDAVLLQSASSPPTCNALRAKDPYSVQP